MHWTRTADLSQATIYFLDFTGARWPVTAAAAKMSESPHFNSYRRSGSLGCPLRPNGNYYHCSDVREFYDPNDGRAGVTFWCCGDQGVHFRDGYTSVWLNNYWGHPTADDYNRAVTCHELGHAGGLGHEQPPTDSCMQDPASINGTWPNPADFELLWHLYNH